MYIYGNNMRIKLFKINSIIMGMENDRKLNRYRVHIDMDAFFAAVECRDEPKLRNIPMAVGSDAMLVSNG
jgi:hypothetical protein